MSGGAERVYSEAYADGDTIRGEGFTMRQADDCPGRIGIDEGHSRDYESRVYLDEPIETVAGNPATFIGYLPDGRAVLAKQLRRGTWITASLRQDRVRSQFRNVRPEPLSWMEPYTRSTLTFHDLQAANHERGKAWGKGQDIPALFNACELGGEAGEFVEAVMQLMASVGKAMNVVKKQYRAEIGIAGGVPDMQPVKDELGDVVICCSLLANKLGIDLGQCVAEKFNKTSDKHGFPHRLAA